MLPQLMANVITVTLAGNLTEITFTAKLRPNYLITQTTDLSHSQSAPMSHIPVAKKELKLLKKYEDYTQALMELPPNIAIHKKFEKYPSRRSPIEH